MPGAPRGGGPRRTVSLGRDEVGEDWPLIRYLLDDSVYAERYLDLMSGVVDGAFDPEELEQRCREYAALIAPYAEVEAGSAAFETGPDNRRVQFVNLPPECTIRIYTIAGVLVRALDHTAGHGGTENFDLATREGLKLASGNYYYHVTTPSGSTHLGRFAVIR